MVGNLQVIKIEDMYDISKNYRFGVHGDVIVVTSIKSRRDTSHPIDEDFKLHTKSRKVTISVPAVKYWSSHPDDDFSLIEVQNAINTLLITYQEITNKNILYVLKENHGKLLNYKHQQEGE